ncbi:MAG: winged helix-turn-helix transcriptional regulator [Candidatus Omnitrophota bacterium]
MVTLKINPRAKVMAARITPEKAEKSKEKGKEKILEMMANSKITTQEIADAIGLNIAGIEKAIRVLKKQGQLQRIGPDKGGEERIYESVKI